MFRPSIGTDELPIRPEYIFDPLRPEVHEDVFENSFVRDDRGNPVAVVREYLGDTFSSGLKELAYLEAAGVKVAKHFPFIGVGHREFIIVEYVDGVVLDKDTAAANPDMCLTLAKQIGEYSAAAIKAGRGVLTDLSSSFQYMLYDGEPVLVDLDMLQYAGTTILKRQSLIASHIYGEFADGEGLVLPDYLDDCANILEPLRSLAAAADNPSKL
jgi:hypothetical protein